MSIKIPFVRKKISALLALSIVILMLMVTSPVLLPLSNFLLVQPVQASSIGSSSSVPMTFKTTVPAYGTISTFSTCEAALTFDARGTNSSGGQK